MGHPKWHRPEPGLRPRCEEEIETTEHTLLRCPARQYARGSFPETLDLKSARYNATAAEMLAKFVHRTFTAYPPGFTPLPRTAAPIPHPLLHNLFALVRRICNYCLLLVCTVMFSSGLFSGFSLLVFSSGVPSLFRFYSHLIYNV